MTTEEEIKDTALAEEQKESVAPEEKTDPTDLIEKANAAAERLEAGNKEMARLIGLQQQAIVEQTLSGKTDAGVPTISKEEKADAEARKLLAGTGMEEYAFPKAKTDSSYN